MARFAGFGASAIGRVRAVNQDSAYVSSSCLLVADGVGGGAAGEIASATTAHVVLAQLRQAGALDPEQSLIDAVRAAQESVMASIQADPDRAGMATTLTALLTNGRSFAVAHIGDSRAYVLRYGESEPELVRITRDHTYVQERIDDGSMLEEEAAIHPWRNVVLRSIHGDPASTPDITPLTLKYGDRVLVCSDGITGMIGEDRLEQIWASCHDRVALAELMRAAEEAGGRDNLSCVLGTVVAGTPRVRGGTPLGAFAVADHVPGVAPAVGSTA